MKLMSKQLSISAFASAIALVALCMQSSAIGSEGSGRPLTEQGGSIGFAGVSALFAAPR